MSITTIEVWNRRLVWLLLSWLLIISVFAASFTDMVRIWWVASTFNHCFLIPLISLYLVYEKRAVLAQMTPRPAWTGLVFLFLSSQLWLIGEVMGAAVLQHIAIVSLLIGSVWALLGVRISYYLIFPLGYLYFSIPEGEFMVPQLMEWTAWVTVKLLRLTGIPVFLEGMYITIPKGNFVVAEACSGINYLIASLALCTVYAYMNYQSWGRRCFFMLLAIIVPLLANGLRAYGIVMIAHMSDMKYATGVDHIIYGWFFFGIVIFILFYLGSLFNEPIPTVDDELKQFGSDESPVSAAVMPLWVVMILLVSMSGKFLIEFVDGTRQVPAYLHPPQAMEPWSEAGETRTLLAGSFPGATQYSSFVYENGDNAVSLDMIYFPVESADAELASGSNHVFSKDDWKRIDERQIQDNPFNLPIRELVLRQGARDYLVWFWYDQQGLVTTNRLQAMIQRGKARLTGSDIGAAGFAVYTEIISDRESARQLLNKFVRDMPPSVKNVGDKPR